MSFCFADIYPIILIFTEQLEDLTADLQGPPGPPGVGKPGRTGPQGSQGLEGTRITGPRLMLVARIDSK